MFHFLFDIFRSFSSSLSIFFPHFFSSSFFFSFFSLFPFVFTAPIPHSLIRSVTISWFLRRHLLSKYWLNRQYPLNSFFPISRAFFYSWQLSALKFFTCFLSQSFYQHSSDTAHLFLPFLLTCYKKCRCSCENIYLYR